MAAYRVAQQADQDLLEIWEYTARRWNIDQAEHLNELFINRFRSLSEQPFQGRLRPDIGPECRSVPLQSFLIIYEPTDYGV
jgi:toxin ParE1/3/4